MSFQPCSCPSCQNATLVPENTETAFCMFCGGSISVRLALATQILAPTATASRPIPQVGGGTGPVAQTRTPTRDGPFGLTMGMTVAELEAEAHAHLQPGETMFYTTRTPPRTVQGMGVLLLTASPFKGLSRIVALSDDIPADVYGSAVMGHFERLKEALVHRYGKPGSDFDFLKTGSIWSDAKDWMMALHKSERVLDVYWIDGNDGVQLPGDLISIHLGAQAPSVSRATIVLAYEFANHPAVVDELQTLNNAGL